MEEVIGEEEKQLVAILVETNPGDEQRSAKRASNILVTIAGLDDAQLVVEPFIGVQTLVTPIPISGSVILIASILDGDVELAAVACAVFSVVIGNKQFHFAHCVHAGCDVAVDAGRPAVLTDNTIEGDHNLTHLPAIDRRCVTAPSA